MGYEQFCQVPAVRRCRGKDGRKTTGLYGIRLGAVIEQQPYRLRIFSQRNRRMERLVFCALRLNASTLAPPASSLETAPGVPKAAARWRGVHPSPGKGVGGFRCGFEDCPQPGLVSSGRRLKDVQGNAFCRQFGPKRSAPVPGRNTQPRATRKLRHGCGSWPVRAWSQLPPQSLPQLRAGSIRRIQRSWFEQAVPHCGRCTLYGPGNVGVAGLSAGSGNPVTAVRLE